MGAVSQQSVPTALDRRDAIGIGVIAIVLSYVFAKLQILIKGSERFVPEVTNIREDGSVTGDMDLHTLNLKANMLWHIDSTFLPVPALTNILIARVVTETGGQTELASSRAAWAWAQAPWPHSCSTAQGSRGASEGASRMRCTGSTRGSMSPLRSPRASCFASTTTPTRCGSRSSAGITS